MENLYIRVARFGFEHSEGFTYGDLETNNVIQNPGEEKIIKEHFNNADYKLRRDASSNLNTMFQVVELGSNHLSSKCILTFEAYFNYFDYLEFQEARKMSQQAIKSSIEATNLARKSISYAKWALIFSIVFSMGGIIVQVWSTYQSTQIDHLQFNEIKNIISSEVKK